MLSEPNVLRTPVTPFASASGRKHLAPLFVVNGRMKVHVPQTGYEKFARGVY